MSSVDDKQSPVVDEATVEGQEGGTDSWKANADDRADMYRLGKTQEMKRNFSFLSIFGFGMILIASWEYSLSLSTIGLVNGGTAGLIWMYLICWVGFTIANMSISEMASMAPTSGGQYHWVSEFAPPKYQKFISYHMGWICVLGWQASCASSAFVAGTQLQGMLVMNSPSYVPQGWHGTLFTMAVALFSVCFNTMLATKLPLIDSIILIIHIFAFFGILVALWVLSPLADATQVFTQFYDGGGWGNLGGSALVGITAGILPLLGVDCAVHMSEELRDAGKNLPRAMIGTTLINGALGWIMIITYCFCIGDMEQVLASPTGYPFMQVFLNSTKSTASATAMTAFIVAMTVFSNLTMVATASRQLFAFARDQAVPFSPWFASVNQSMGVPFNSIVTTFIITSILAMINIGSSVALNSITSLATTSLLSSYIVSTACMIWRRVTGAPLLPSKYSLGKWGLTVNIVSEVFLVIVFVLAFMPATPTVTAETMNWNIVIYGGVVIIALAYYFYKGINRYEGPVAYVRKLQ